MLVSEAIKKAYLFESGKTTVLAQTSNKWLQLLALADAGQKEWQGEPGIDWMSLYNLYNLGTVSASTGYSGTESTLFAIDLDSDMRKISQREEDSVVLLGTDGTSTWEYDIIQPDQLIQYSGRDACALIQGQLVFASQFHTGDARIGATITCPGYGYVPDITRVDGGDTIVVDDPMWLCYYMAAQMASTDLVRQGQYPNLLARQNNLMHGMIADNVAQITEIPVDMDMYDLGSNNVGESAWF